MRLTSLLVPFALVMTTATPASAATIIQFSSGVAAVPGGFAAFDPVLGVLTGVTLDVTARSNRNGFVSTLPATGGSAAVSWTINGALSLVVSSLTGPSLAAQSVAISGAGATSRSAPGAFDIAATGTGSFSLTPSFFLTDTAGPFDYRITPSDPGLFSPSLDSVFTGGAFGLSGACFGAPGGSDECDDLRYTLTYDYTPTRQTAPVPEPSTWAMMLIGLFAVGVARRRSGRLATA